MDQPGVAALRFVEWLARDVAQIVRDGAAMIQEVAAIVPPGDVRIIEMKCAD